MKKLITLALACAALVSCNKEENEGIDPNAPVEIKLNAGIEATARAAINPGDAVSAVQFFIATGSTPSWATVTEVNTAGNIAATGAITFDTPQFYPADGTNTNILGFYPAATSIAAGVASMTINGENDVIYASSVSGSKATPMGSMTFSHKLTQFKFVIQRDATTDDDITNVNVNIKDANSTFKLALTDGTLSDWATSISTIAPFTAGTAATTATNAIQAIMLEPNMESIMLTVIADGYPSKDITITGTDSDSGKNIFKAGHAYTITLTFKGTGIEPEATFAEWEVGTAGSADIK